MRASMQDYYREVEERASQFTRDQEMRERADHLRAFNFGRTVQRIERTRRDLGIRIVFLTVGLVVGMTIGRPSKIFMRRAAKVLVTQSHSALPSTNVSAAILAAPR